MKFRLLLHFCLLVFFLTLISSCEYGFIEFETVEPDPDPDVELSFSDEIIPIFNNKCNMTGCHTAGHFAVDLTPENAWQDIHDKGLLDLENPANSSFYTKLVEPGTHDNRSLPAEQQKILQWITEGAKNN
jgi:hypothetical protein